MTDYYELHEKRCTVSKVDASVLGSTETRFVIQFSLTRPEFAAVYEALKNYQSRGVAGVLFSMGQSRLVFSMLRNACAESIGRIVGSVDF